MTKLTKKQAALDKALRAKVAGMTAAQRDARAGELYKTLKTPETDLEWVKLVYGADVSIGEVKGPATVETYLRGTTPRGPMPQTTHKTKTQKT